MELTIADHTLLTQAIIDRPLHVIRYLEVPKGVVPTSQQVLDAAMKVRSFDADTKARLRRVHELYPTIEAGQAQLPQSFIDKLEGLRAQITGKPVDQQLSAIYQTRDAQRSDDLLVTSLDLAGEILRDGADSIYGPDSPIIELLDVAIEGELQDVASADVVGGALGGGVGLFVGGIGAAPGAAAGAAGASAGTIIADVVIAIIG